MGKFSKESYVEVDYSDFSATAAAEAALEEEEFGTGKPVDYPNLIAFFRETGDEEYARFYERLLEAQGDDDG